MMNSGLPKVIILEYAPPIKRAEQTKPDTRAARRQAKREKDRKWEIKYAESEGKE